MITKLLLSAFILGLLLSTAQSASATITASTTNPVCGAPGETTLTIND